MTNDIYYQWAQLRPETPERWKKLIIRYSNINRNYVYQNHQVTKGAFLSLEKLTSKVIYSFLILSNINKPT